MIKKLTFLACLASTCLFANQNSEFDSCSNQIGRYQICSNDKELYLLETDTGKIWVAKKWECKDISLIYPNGWKQLKIGLPLNGLDSPDKINRIEH
jgi:hypothetical protein